MKTFDFFFGVCLLHNVLCHIDNLSNTFQHIIFSAAEGQQLVRVTTTPHYNPLDRGKVEAVLTENCNISQ